MTEYDEWREYHVQKIKEADPDLVVELALAALIFNRCIGDCWNYAPDTMEAYHVLCDRLVDVFGECEPILWRNERD